MLHALQGEQDALRINIALMTGNFFDIICFSAVAGRLLNEGDDGTKAAPVIIDGRSVPVVGIVQPSPFSPH